MRVARGWGSLPFLDDLNRDEQIRRRRCMRSAKGADGYGTNLGISTMLRGDQDFERRRIVQRSKAFQGLP